MFVCVVGNKVSIWEVYRLTYTSLLHKAEELKMNSLRKFQVMPENCRKISRYAGQEFHLMPESSA